MLLQNLIGLTKAIITDCTRLARNEQPDLFV